MASSAYIAIRATSPAGQNDTDIPVSERRPSSNFVRGTLLSTGVIALVGAAAWLRSDRQRLRVSSVAEQAGRAKDDSSTGRWPLLRLDGNAYAQDSFASTHYKAVGFQAHKQKSQEETFIYTKPCDCSWASNSSCSKSDDDSECFKACCTKSQRRCENRGGCTCDCSWASKAACTLDDGGCCWGCCCQPIAGVFHYDTEPPPKCFELDDPTLYHAPTSSLFCYSLIIPGSYEPELMKMQYEMDTGIFACEGFAIYSNKLVHITEDIYSRVLNTSLKCDYGGEFGTALNTEIFAVVWQRIHEDGQYRLYSWTAKVDADSVFLPWRLRVLLLNHVETEKGVYLNNCIYGLHGPIEIFSRNAVTTWIHGRETCVKFFDKLCSGPCWWGEDMWIDQCLEKVLGVRRDNSSFVLIEDHCDPPTGWKKCDDPLRLSFHPFKKKDEYRSCLEGANKRCPIPEAAKRISTTTSTTMTNTAIYGYDATYGYGGDPYGGAYSGGGYGSGSVTPITTADFNCGDGRLAWWTEEQKDYCCQTVGWGCEEVQAEESVNGYLQQEASVPADGCRNACPYSANPDGTCATHTQTIAEQLAASTSKEGAPVDAKGPCKQAYVMTVQMCSVCQTCALSMTGCNVSALLKKDSVPSSAPVTMALPSPSKEPAKYTDEASNVPRYNCTRGFDNWELEWSFDKMSWCCKEKQRGCIEQPSQQGTSSGSGAMTLDSSRPQQFGGGGFVGNGDVQQETISVEPMPLQGRPVDATTSDGGVAALASSSDVAGANPTEAPWFDCNEGFWDWEHLWSEEQKPWCCKNAHRGCQYPSSFNCSEDLRTWEDSWSGTKKKYCCKLGKPGCSMFNCTLDYTTMNGGWSTEKARWCCRYEGKACEQVQGTAIG